MAVVTIKTLNAMGIEVELETMEMPDFARISQAFGTTLELGMIRITKLRPFRQGRTGCPDLTINTHGDVLPYLKDYFTKRNSIVYCHYPIGQSFMNQDDNLPPELFQNMSSNSCLGANDSGLDDARKTYNQMMLRSTVLTNSEFSRKAIQDHFGVDSMVLNPPVDVDTFRDAALSSNVRDNSILVVSRFHPSKNITNAIHLARMLKQNGVGKFVKIVGNVSRKQLYYLCYLKGLVKKYHLESFVSFEINVKFERLLELMRRAKVYFHTMRGEPFGISIVEAMSAGLIPVVPDFGGPTEFVPEKYQFRGFGQAVEAVAEALDAPASERYRLSDSIKKYSISNYAAKFALIMDERFETGRSSQVAPVIMDIKANRQETSSK